MFLVSVTQQSGQYTSQEHESLSSAVKAYETLREFFPKGDDVKLQFRGVNQENPLHDAGRIISLIQNYKGATLHLYMSNDNFNVYVNCTGTFDGEYYDWTISQRVKGGSVEVVDAGNSCAYLYNMINKIINLNL